MRYFSNISIMDVPHGFLFQTKIWKWKFKILKTNVFIFVKTYILNLISIHRTLER